MKTPVSSGPSRRGPGAGLPAVVPHKYKLEKLLTNTVGGTTTMVVNGSVTPVKFEYTVPIGEQAIIMRCLILVMDQATRPDRWGAVTFSNGVGIEHIGADGNVLFDFTDGLAMINTGRMSLLAGSDIPVIDVTGAAQDAGPIRWTLGHSGGGYPMQEGEKFRVTINDNNTVDAMYWKLQGIHAPLNMFTRGNGLLGMESL